jgi:hypothetical protein
MIESILNIKHMKARTKSTMFFLKFKLMSQLSKMLHLEKTKDILL